MLKEQDTATKHDDKGVEVYHICRQQMNLLFAATEGLLCKQSSNLIRIFTIEVWIYMHAHCAHVHLETETVAFAYPTTLVLISQRLRMHE